MDEMDNICGYMGGASGGLNRDFSYEATFEPGNYLIVTEMEWDTGLINRNYVISAYVNNLVNLVEMNRKDNYMKLIKNMGEWFVKENRNKEDNGIEQALVADEVTRYVFKTGGRVFFFYENN